MGGEACVFLARLLAMVLIWCRFSSQNGTAEVEKVSCLELRVVL